MKKTIAIIIFSFVSTCLFGQQAMSFQEAETAHISVRTLDSLYKSAVHSDTTLAVFKTQKDQELLIGSYGNFLQELGSFLEKNNFKWKKPTKCFNRIYIDKSGRVDYYLFNFLGKSEDKPSLEKTTLFKELVNNFIQTNQFGVSAQTNFALCSPTVFKPNTP